MAKNLGVLGMRRKVLESLLKKGGGRRDHELDVAVGWGCEEVWHERIFPFRHNYSLWRMMETGKTVTISMFLAERNMNGLEKIDTQNRDIFFSSVNWNLTY